MYDPVAIRGNCLFLLYAVFEKASASKVPDEILKTLLLYFHRVPGSKWHVLNQDYVYVPLESVEDDQIPPKTVGGTMVVVVIDVIYPPDMKRESTVVDVATDDLRPCFGAAAAAAAAILSSTAAIWRTIPETLTKHE